MAQKCMCPNDHVLKAKSKHPSCSGRINCDICRRDGINADNNFFFRCDFSCNFDMCACCYYLLFAGETTAFNKIKEAAKRTMARDEAIDMIRGLHLMSLLGGRMRSGPF